VIRVVVADDHAIVRAGVRAVLTGESDIVVVGEAADAASTIESVERHRPDLVLVDLSMPGSCGADIVSRIRRRFATTKILVLTMHATTESVTAALDAGAHGYVVKGSGLEDLVFALRAVAGGERFLDATASKRVAEADDAAVTSTGELDQLTPREREVMRLVATGCTNREIARLLAISPKTVDTHRTSLMRKLDLHDVQALTRLAMRRGLVSDE
jgi:DNA-binding NarL/FixJ family response regulator